MIAAAEAHDVDAVAALHVRSWQVAYREILAQDYLASLSVEGRAASWRQVLHKDDSRLLVDREPGAGVRGFVSLGRCRDAGAPAGRGEVMALYVDPVHWGRGVGHGLLVAAVQQLQRTGFDSVSLWVLAQNEAGIRFYQRAGFRAVRGSETSFELGGRSVQEVCYLHTPSAS